MIRRTAVAVTSAAVLSLGGAALATPASAAPNNVRQDGLVNLALTDVVIQAPVSIAANICGVAVNVLATQLGSGPVSCTALGGAMATRGGGGGGNNVQQRGLVNIAVTDATVQLPISAAVNVCGFGVNVLSLAALPVAPATVNCTAISNAAATAKTPSRRGHRSSTGGRGASPPPRRSGPLKPHSGGRVEVGGAASRLHLLSTGS